jgi:hypothetical protein
LSWRASYAVTKSRRALGAIRDCHEDTELRLTKCRMASDPFYTGAGVRLTYWFFALVFAAISPKGTSLRRMMTDGRQQIQRRRALSP